MIPLNVALSATLMVSAIITGAMAAYSFARRSAPGAAPLAGFMLAMSVYAAAYGCELLNTTLPGIALCLKIEYLGIAFLPPLYILTVVQISSKRRTRFGPAVLVLFILSFLTLFFLYTNDRHHLFYSAVGIDRSGPFPVASLASGPWYWVHITYINAAQLYCNILLIKMLAGSASRHRKQAGLMLAGSLIPWAGLIAYLLGFTPWGIDLNPFTLTITGIILAWGLLSNSLVDLFPVAYDALFRHLPEGVIVLDADERVTRLNPAARRMTGIEGDPAGVPARGILPHLPVSGCDDTKIDDCLMHIGKGTPSEKWLDLRTTPLVDAKKRDIGRLLTLRDVTETRRMEMTILANEKRLKAEISRVRNIQAAMLPDFSRASGYDIASAFLPANELSGDFIDGFFIGDSVFQVIICDVMHHGMASAYIGMEIRSLFRAYSGGSSGPGRLIAEVNAKLTEDFSEIMYFATVAVCRIDLASGTLVYSSGGHPPSLILPAGSGTVRETGFTGPLIGLRKDNSYSEMEIPMSPGNCLLMYTDGVTEARGSADGNLYGRGSLAAEFAANAHGSSKEAIHSLLDRVFEYTDYAPLEDDISMICIKMKEA